MDKVELKDLYDLYKTIDGFASKTFKGKAFYIGGQILPTGTSFTVWNDSDYDSPLVFVINHKEGLDIEPMDDDREKVLKILERFKQETIMKTLTIEDIYKDVKNEVRSRYGFHAYMSDVADDMKWYESFSYKIEKLDDSFIEIQVLKRDDFLALLEGIIENKKANMKETTLSDVINSLQNWFHDGKFTNTFAHPIGADCWEVLAKCKNIGTMYHYSIEVLDKDALLLELLSIDKHGQDEETPTDPINPTHYNGTQTLDRMVAVFGVDAVISFCEINAFKYRMRAGKKDGNPIEQDIKKALWYEGKAEELKNNR